MAFEGPGARVQKAQKDSPAAAVGIEPGDVIVAMDGAEITDLRALVRAIGAKKAGDGFKITFRRGDQAIEKEGRFPEPRPAPELGRDRPWGSIRADAKENVVEVRAEGIRSFELFLGEPLFDLSKPVTVRVNGKVVHEGVVAPDLRFLAEQAALDQDRTMIYLARLRIAVGS
jgi:membrane-associated protease RseP (regulator of RpoE activity)